MLRTAEDGVLGFWEQDPGAKDRMLADGVLECECEVSEQRFSARWTSRGADVGADRDDAAVES